MRKQLADIATADIAIDIEDDTIEELFNDAALSFSESTLELNKLDLNKEKKISLKAENIEKLLFAFLEELIFIKDTEGLIFKEYNFKIKKNNLECVAKGDIINQKKHEVLDDIKAITYHQFKIEQKNNKWYAR